MCSVFPKTRSFFPVPKVERRYQTWNIKLKNYRILQYLLSLIFVIYLYILFVLQLTRVRLSRSMPVIHFIGLISSVSSFLFSQLKNSAVFNGRVIKFAKIKLEVCIYRKHFEMKKHLKVSSRKKIMLYYERLISQKYNKLMSGKKVELLKKGRLKSMHKIKGKELTQAKVATQHQICKQNMFKVSNEKTQMTSTDVALLLTIKTRTTSITSFCRFRC